MAEGGRVGAAGEGEGAGAEGAGRGAVDEDGAGGGEDAAGEVDIGPGVDRAPVESHVGVAEGLGMVGVDVTGEVSAGGEGGGGAGTGESPAAAGGEGVSGGEIESAVVIVTPVRRIGVGEATEAERGCGE